MTNSRETMYLAAKNACEAARARLETEGFEVVGVSGQGDATYMAHPSAIARIRIATYAHAHFSDAAQLVFPPIDALYGNDDIEEAVDAALIAWREIAAREDDSDEADLDAIANMSAEEIAAALKSK